MQLEQDLDHRISIVVNKELPTWQALNAVAHVSAYYGNWLAEQDRGTLGTNNARDPETIGDLIFDLVGEHLIALRAQLQTVTRPEWLERQSAADVALLLGAERDTLLRLLAGFRPVERQPELDAGPARAAPSAADDAD